MAITFGAESQGVKNKYIEALLNEGMNTGPIQSHWQGASRLAHALLGGLELREADQMQKAGPAEIAAVVRKISGGQAPPPGAPGTPAMPPSPMASALAGEPPVQPPQAPQESAPIQPRPVPTMRMPPVGSAAARVASAFSALPQGGGMPDIPPVTGPRPGGPVPSMPNVVGDEEGERLGIYPPTNGAGAPREMPPSMAPSPGLTSGPRPQQAQYQPTQAPPMAPPTAQAMPQAQPQPGQPPQLGSNLSLQQLTDEFEQAKTPAAKQFLFGLIQERLKQPHLKSVVIGDRGFVFDERIGRYTEGPDATKATDLERNLAAENRSRKERGLPPMSVLEYQGALEAAQAQGKERGGAAANLDTVLDSSNRALGTIDAIRKHPGKQYGVGLLGVLPGIPGTAQRGFVNLVDQAKGQSFLEAFNSLRGGGQITEAEGRKATQALARLDRAQSQEDFDAALNDLEGVIRTGMSRARLKATGQTRAGTQPQGGNNDPLGIR